MEKTIQFSWPALLAAGGVGMVVGTAMNQDRPRVASAKAAVPALPPNDGKLRIIISGRTQTMPSIVARAWP